MKIKYFEKIKNENYLSDIMNLLTVCNNEFIPPLSSRDSTTQSELSGLSGYNTKPVSYFENIRNQPAFLAIEDKHVIAFMSIKRNHVCEEIPPSMSPNIYVTTVIVNPAHRHRGITNTFYHRLFKKFDSFNVFTRTWSTNTSHTRILSSLKFYEHYRIENDRGEGIDTVYYYHGPVAKKGLQILRQYHLSGNVMFLALLIFLSVFFVLTWMWSNDGMMHELSIAFATSLIASVLCLLSDTFLKYRESQNDEYINNLKNYGIENLQFHKDELLESILRKCRNEIWITGYRLIMTGKQSFRRALCDACARTHGLKIKLLAVPPYSSTFQLVYGNEDVSENYINIFSDLYSCVEAYGTQLEIRFTDKPIFNDTYKVDDRFITGPYLHCMDNHNGRITAKDFFSLDINDPHKELYGLIFKDYMTVWDESTTRLDLQLFSSRLKELSQEPRSLFSKEARLELLKECCVSI